MHSRYYLKDLFLSPKVMQKLKSKRVNNSLFEIIDYIRYIIISLVLLASLYKLGVRFIGDIWLNFERRIIVGQIISEEYNIIHTSTGERMYYYKIMVNGKKIYPYLGRSKV